MLNLSLSQTGNWQLIYYQVHAGNLANRGTKIPMIEVIELPVTIASRILAVGASYLAAPPSWYTAGYFYQEVRGIRLDDTLIFPGVSGGSPAVLDASKRRITLNTIELHIFERLASEHSYRFEPMKWLPKITLGVWQYVGIEADSTEELIETLKVDLTRIEVKVDNL